MHPVLQRTWAPRGQTPLLRQRTRHHRRISAIGAVSISPQRRRLGWYLQFHRDQSIRQEQVIVFLRHLLRHLHGPVTVIWDRLNAHRGGQVRDFILGQPRLACETLPAYAPELNPEEYGWAYLKRHALANYCPDDLDQLQDAVLAAADTARPRQVLLRSFVHACGLPLRF